MNKTSIDYMFPRYAWPDHDCFMDCATERFPTRIRFLHALAFKGVLAAYGSNVSFYPSPPKKERLMWAQLV